MPAVRADFTTPGSNPGRLSTAWGARAGGGGFVFSTRSKVRACIDEAIVAIDCSSFASRASTAASAT